MKRLILILALSFALVSCGASNPATVGTPAPPNSPQTQALNITKAITDAITAAVNTTIRLRDAGKVSQADTTTIENWAKSAYVLDDTITTELTSADAWTLQKQKILVMLPLFKIPGTSTTDTTIQAALAAISAVVSQLQGAVQ